jgi:cell division protein FtsW (lipid II flippase)
MFLIDKFFAGALALVFHWGAAVAIIILLLALAYFSPLYKKWFLGAAGVVFLCLVAYGVGIADEASRAQAQQQVIIKYVDRIVDRTKTPRYRARKDPYDNRNN